MDRSALGSTCPDEEFLVAFLEKTLDETKARAIEHHVDACDDCRGVLTGYAQAGFTSHSTSRDELEATTRPNRGGAKSPRAGEPPTRIGEYELVRLLGRGGMGGVWLARDTVLERDVAIKIGEVASLELRLRARVEARAVARLAHPNIVSVHYAGEVDDRPMLVTELLSGQSLDRFDVPLAAQRVAAIGADIARALAAAHRAGVVHRDVKPGNAFLCEDGRAKLLDFGLAHIRETPGVGGTPASRVAAGNDTLADRLLIGTPLYMAPETWRAEPATPSGDVYSLGALLHELLTGRTPYTGRHVRELRKVVLAGRLENLAATVPLAPPELVAVVTRCLHLEPSARPSAEEVCHELEALLTPPSATEDETPDLDTNPYRGLLPFDAEHRGSFFGRVGETEAVLDAIHASPFVLVVGVSGAGKSSLVRAGVLPRVLAGALGAATWRVATIVPGARPVERLVQEIAKATGTPRTLSELQSSHAVKQTERLLLFVDQLEEVWTQADANSCAAFFEALSGMSPAVRIVATLRGDFLGRLGELPLRRVPVLVGPLSDEGVREAIAGPLRRRGVTMDPALTEALVEIGSLPLLEFTLASLWERRDRESKTLGMADLVAIGGLDGALGELADDTLQSMSRSRCAEARRILLELVTVDGLRARREENELSLGNPDSRAALDALVAARLVVASTGDLGTAYEIAHEAIVTGWPTLRAWLDEESAARELGDRLARAAAEWERLGRDREGLLRERQLREIELVPQGPLPAREKAFVEASLAAVRRSRRRRMAMRMGLVLGLVLTASGAWGAAVRRHHEKAAGLVSEARTLETRADETELEALDLRARAFALFDTDDLGPAEDLWKERLTRERKADEQRQEVGAILDRALAVEPGMRSARALYADVLFARAIAAERMHDGPLFAELSGRLGVHDDGSRVARVFAAGRVKMETDPPGAAMVLSRYRDRGDGHLVEDDAAQVEEGSSRDLPPGSYLLVATLPGRYTTRYPFKVDRGENLALRISLPRAADVPEGMIYVPAGRFLYGSGDDEATRALFTHQPMRPIELPAFLVARRETLWTDYLAFLRDLPQAERVARTPSNVTLDANGAAVVAMGGTKLSEGQPFCAPERTCVDWRILPVSTVNGEDAAAYASWLARTGRLPGARLCTDREWERAARGADDRRYAWGDGDVTKNDACSFAYGDDPWRAGPCAPGMHPAAQSPFGIDDVTGNVWELTSGTPDIAQPSLRSQRGGGFDSWGAFVALTNRGLIPSTLRLADTGVRVCTNPR
jgi:serine/threonine protein kinase/formylglycine-generating enzyme required for sulfatase activity